MMKEFIYSSIIVVVFFTIVAGIVLTRTPSKKDTEEIKVIIPSQGVKCAVVEKIRAIAILCWKDDEPNNGAKAVK
jgi:uncharacterized membrane protein